jgi:hypothetical protein
VRLSRQGRPGVSAEARSGEARERLRSGYARVAITEDRAAHSCTGGAEDHDSERQSG